MATATKQLKVIALDHGNVFVKGYAGAKEKMLLLPNSIVRKDLMESDSFWTSKSILNEYVSSKYDDDNVYLWGQDIYKQLNPINTYTEQDRYSQKAYKLLTEFALAELAHDGDDLLVVTGLPSRQKGTSQEDDLRKVFDGAHVVKRNGDDRVIKVKTVKTLTQPLGTAMYLYLDDDGKVKDESLGEEYIGILDAGGGTFDLDGVRALDAVGADRDTIPNGLFKVYQKISDAINNENPSAQATPKKVEFQILSDSPDSYVISRRAKMDISKIKAKAFKDYAEDIIPLINQRWTNRDKFDRIILTGGGAKILAPFFKEWEKDITVIEENSQIANVVGFYRYGVFVNNNSK